MYCSSRRVVGIAVERPLKHVVAAMLPGIVVHSVSIKTGKITITFVDSKHRPTIKIIRKEGALQHQCQPRNQEQQPALQYRE